VTAAHWQRTPLGQADIDTLATGRCADCKSVHALRPGPKGGMMRNWACEACGSEFNLGSFRGRLIMATRNSRPGEPNQARLRSVFGIELRHETET